MFLGHLPLMFRMNFLKFCWEPLQLMIIHKPKNKTQKKSIGVSHNSTPPLKLSVYYSKSWIWRISFFGFETHPGHGNLWKKNTTSFCSCFFCKSFWCWTAASRWVRCTCGCLTEWALTPPFPQCGWLFFWKPANQLRVAIYPKICRVLPYITGNAEVFSNRITSSFLLCWMPRHVFCCVSSAFIVAGSMIEITTLGMFPPGCQWQVW